MDGIHDFSQAQPLFASQLPPDRPVGGRWRRIGQAILPTDEIREYRAYAKEHPAYVAAEHREFTVVAVAAFLVGLICGLLLALLVF